MVDILHEIRRAEPQRKTRCLDVPVSQLGFRMIDLYYSTSNIRSRKLIMDFMQRAGFNWLRKLIMRDTSPMVSVAIFASLDDYVRLIAANDDVGIRQPQNRL